MLGPAVWSDIIDYDEYHSGQRKEGSYFAAASFVMKSTGAIPFILSGFALELGGYVPNEAQSESTLFAIRAVFALFPGACYALAALVISRLSFTDEEHGRIREVLDARLSEGGS